MPSGMGIEVQAAEVAAANVTTASESAGDANVGGSFSQAASLIEGSAIGNALLGIDDLLAAISADVQSDISALADEIRSAAQTYESTDESLSLPFEQLGAQVHATEPQRAADRNAPHTATPPHDPKFLR